MIVIFKTFMISDIVNTSLFLNFFNLKSNNKLYCAKYTNAIADYK